MTVEKISPETDNALRLVQLQAHKLYQTVALIRLHPSCNKLCLLCLDDVPKDEPGPGQSQ